MDLVGVAEVATMLGVSRQQVHRLARREDFPAPVAELSAGKVWNRAEVEEWARTHPRRRGRPEKPYP